MTFSESPRRTFASRRGRPSHATIAREQPGCYDRSVRRDADGHDATGGGGPRTEQDATEEAAAVEAPFGLPVLAELPELAAALDRVATADRCLVEAVLTLRRLSAEGSIETTTGVGLEHWLAVTARMAGLDRRLLRRMCRLLDRLPRLAAGAADGDVSFTQLRALTLELHAVPRAIDESLDRWLDAAIVELPADADPDALVKQAARAADELAPRVLDEQTHLVANQRGLTIQPFLDGTGGTFHGTEDAAGLALLDAATAPRRDQLDRGLARARADNLQRRLTNAWTDDGDHLDGDHLERADDAGLHGLHGDAAGWDDDGTPLDALPTPTLLLRWDVAALFDQHQSPADILTRLVGGTLRLTSTHARRLIEARGAKLRSVIIDQGEVVGVGRATRVPPDWLRDATLAIHATCTAPLCDRPALGADLDHARPWHPDDPDGAGGRTDGDNLGPLCGTTNRDKRASGWRSDQRTRGIRTWRHPRSGLSLTTVPATWRPTGVPPPPHCRHRRSPRSSGGGHGPAPPTPSLPLTPRGIGPPADDDHVDADQLPPHDDDPLPF